jgi:RsiW-degrading membrane proteinase PrsW (M82 family)
VSTLADVPAAGGLLPRRRPRTVIVLGLVLATGAVLCGWAIYLDLNGLIGRTALLYALAFAFIPVVPLAAAFLWLDRLRPEPAGLLVVALLWGALAATYLSLTINGWLARQVGDEYGATARSAVYIAPWVEETCKGAVVFLLVWWRRHDFNSVLAGAVYGGLAGIGFAFTENIVYYGQLFERVKQYQGGQDVALRAVEHLFLWRGVAAPFVHPMFTMLTGIGVGLAVRHRHIGVRIVAPVAGFCAAVLLHMSYNAAASFAPGRNLTAVYLALLVPALLTLVGLVLLVRRWEYRVIQARLGDYSAFGWLPSSEVAFISTARGRRRARRYVRPAGRSERETLREFQQTGLDLGVLRDRMVRGVVGADELPREEVLIRRLRAVRERVMLPDTGDALTPRLTRASSSW